MTPLIDFDGINAAALRSARSLLPQLIPGGKFRSLEFIARNPRRNDQNPGSFSINYKSGIWKDFATGDGSGDLISLAAYVWGTRPGDAARRLADTLGVPVFKPNGIAGNTKASASTTKTNGHAQEIPQPTPHIETSPPIAVGDENGPPAWRPELRRHMYPDGVRLKIKFASGDPPYTQLYRVDGKWLSKKPNDYLPVPYTTRTINPLDPELAADDVLWPEGEKDVDSLSSINLPALTFGGTGDGLPDGIESYLKDRQVVILADNDEPGTTHAEKKAALAHAAGAASVKIVHFPELPPKGDVSDFIASGGTAEQLTDRVDGASVWAPTLQDKPVSLVHDSQQDWRARIVMANDLQAITFPPVRHILPGYISEGATIIAGKPKIGKSWLTLDLCLAATANRFTLGTLKPAQGDVLYLALEDNNRRLKRRMAKLWPSSDARWPGRLALVTDWKRADEGGLDDIEDWCRSVADPVMVVIDTLEKFRPIQNGKSAAYSADYGAVTGLQKIASRHRIAVVINHHVRKMEADDPFDTVSGTLGLTGAADTIIVLKRHAGAVTLHARGRDIEEVETALQFEKGTCRWTVLGAASEVYVSNERAAVISALATAGPEGWAVPEIMAATSSTSRGAMDTLLFKMREGGEIVRVKRGYYALPQDGGKIGQKERSEGQTTENKGLDRNLSNLSDLTGSSASSNKWHGAPCVPLVADNGLGLIATEETGGDR